VASLLPYDWTLCAALAVTLGGWNGKPWKLRLALGLAVGVVGWAASFPLMIVGTRFGYDSSLAEDYLNGIDVRNSLVGILAISAWVMVWFGVGTAIGLFWRWVAGKDPPPAERG